jgi:putative ABC transport system ATP-binding protein
MIRAVNLVKEYEGGAIKALQGVSLEIPKGAFHCIVGPSGSGKSTLLHMIGALDRPTAGEVFLNGRSLATERDLDGVRAREVGFIFQLHNLLPQLTSVENVEIPMMAVGASRAERRARAEELLAQVGLGHRLRSIATKLSGGERQRVSIARALANRPAVILADEPTGDVDSKTGDEILRALMDAREKSGATLVVVTHNPKIGTDADRVHEMADGRLTDLGSGREYAGRISGATPR